MIIVPEVASKLKTFLGHCVLRPLARTMMMRVVLAFIMQIRADNIIFREGDASDTITINEKVPAEKRACQDVPGTPPGMVTYL